MRPYAHIPVDVPRTRTRRTGRVHGVFAILIAWALMIFLFVSGFALPAFIILVCVGIPVILIARGVQMLRNAGTEEIEDDPRPNPYG